MSATQLAPADATRISELLHAAQPLADGSGYFVRNHGHNLDAWVTSAGASINFGGAEMRLRFTGMGRDALATATTGTISAAGATVTTEHEIAGQTVSEWWVNHSSGLEHGFTVPQRPIGSGELRLMLALSGSVAPAIVAADAIALGDVTRYDGLKVYDAAGRLLPARFELDGSQLAVVLDDAAAEYPLTVDPLLTQHAYLKASNTGSFDYFGRSVATSGDTVVIGAPHEASSARGVNGSQGDESAPYAGAAYVFVRVGGSWSQQAYLKASNTGTSDRFGQSVAISGDTIVVGAYGERSNATGVNGNEADNSASFAGAAYVFTRTSGTWSQQAYLKPSNTNESDEFGYSVAIDGDTLVVGAQYEDSNATGVNGDQADNSAADAGAAYVFTRTGGAWTQQAYLKASNTGVGDFFSRSVAISGDTIVVGAGGEDSSASGVNGDQANNGAANSGATYVYRRTGDAWTQEAYLKASNTGASDFFGVSVAISGDTIVVGAVGEDSSARGVNGDQADNSAVNAGAAYLFTRTSAVWTPGAYLKASNTGADDYFGDAVAASGGTVVIGAPYEDSVATGVNGNSSDDSLDTGAAYVFVRPGGSWSQQAYVKASNPDAYDWFGRSVAVSGDTVVAGAPEEDSTATGVDGNGADNSRDSAGAAYVFGTPCATAPFSDVPASHTFCGAIEWMKQTGISTGFDDSTYRPTAPVTRQAMSAFLARLAGASLTPCSTPPFLDVPTDHQFCREIQWMADAGISTGFPDGTYRPTLNVSRQAMAAFMARAAGGTLSLCDAPPFEDVASGHSFCPEIQWVKEAGITTGFPDGTYRPAENVTRQAMAAFMERLRNWMNFN